MPIDTPNQAVQVGDEVVVTITEIDPLRRRLALSCRR
ncbi:S1 RNA-binding domain-containing protein [Actinoplanes sp. LDG1-01]|uniref:S1 RNA-binding domain-containing protein n=1 Tax=Paractinoplanes lichenicola TaxID=2802976 RepID=A0ABS1VUR1_9ACTN|nr:S1 RNA-binding domain-containing protein [Actinoplanes lichenicola]